MKPRVPPSFLPIDALRRLAAAYRDLSALAPPDREAEYRALAEDVERMVAELVDDALSQRTDDALDP